MKKYLLLFLVFILGGLSVWLMVRKPLFEARRTESPVVVLDKIKTVTKLISVEGNFSELYGYDERYDYDYFNLFSKKILLRVTAKVSVGYDFNKMNIKIDSLHKTVTLSPFPQPEILSIDHNLDYYDITEGTFNKFTKEEYNTINRKAKDFIATKAHTDQLIAKAESEKQEYIDMMEMALKSAGWRLIIPEINIKD